MDPEAFGRLTGILILVIAGIFVIRGAMKAKKNKKEDEVE